MEEERQLAEPPKPHNFITFLNGCDALYLNHFPNQEKGTIIFRFVPHEHMVWKMNIPEVDYDIVTGYIEKEYPEKYCVNMSSSRNSTRWFILCDYNGKDTKILNLFFRKFTDKIEKLLHRIRTLETADRLTKKESYDMLIHNVDYESKLIRKFKERGKLEEENE